MTDDNDKMQRLASLHDPNVILEDADDHVLAMRLLTGERIEHTDGRVTYRYLRPGSAEERAARVALVRLLLSGRWVPMSLRLRLAALFNPEDGSETRTEAEPCKLEIRPRRRGPPALPPVAGMGIASDVAREVASGCKVEVAVEDAATRYGVDRSTAYRAWKTYRKDEVNALVEREFAFAVLRMVWSARNLASGAVDVMREQLDAATQNLMDTAFEEARARYELPHERARLAWEEFRTAWNLPAAARQYSPSKAIPDSASLKQPR
jgi:hypothetical protein